MSATNIGGVPSLANNHINQISVLNALVPPEGAKSLAVNLDFTSASSVLVDLTITTAQVLISTVQAIFADNSGNDAELIVTSAATQQVLRIPPGAQGWFSLVATNRPKLTFATPAGIGIIQCLLLNVPVSQQFWYPSGSPLGAGIGAAVVAITTGGTAQNVWAAGSVPSDGAVIRNPKNASESLYVDIVHPAQVSQSGGTNGTSVELAAGESFTVPPGFAGAVSVNAATTNHAFVAYGAGKAG